MDFSIRSRIRQYLRPAEDKLREKLEKNPYYPFQVLSPNEILILVVCSMTLIGWISNNSISNNNLFLFPIMGIIVSLASIYNHRSTRTYIINLNEMYYAFNHGKTLYTKSNLHNIYIRLKKEARSGSSVARRQDSYHLILNGYQIDNRQISGATKNQNELRKLGQQIAFQLQINYFDEFNTSEHHVIRHFRPTKGTANSNSPNAPRIKALSEILWNRDAKNEN